MNKMKSQQFNITSIQREDSTSFPGHVSFRWEQVSVDPEGEIQIPASKRAAGPVESRGGPSQWAD